MLKRSAIFGICMICLVAAVFIKTNLIVLKCGGRRNKIQENLAKGKII
jgi:hypothetical protein